MGKIGEDLKSWNNQPLKGEWLVTYKLDGVRAFVSNGQATSKAGKPLHNLSHIPDGDYEIYTGDWATSITAVRTKAGVPVDLADVYRLDPPAKMLIGPVLTNPEPEVISTMLDYALSLKYEGIVLRQGDVWLKVKPTTSYDVPILGFTEGKGRNTGKVGALVTSMGKVGTGLTDIDRLEFLTLPIGTIIEVECMELTDNGKFRHPRFIRVREDL